MTTPEEICERFECFGDWCALSVTGAGEQRSAREAIAHARGLLEQWHLRFSRFLPDSELSQLNGDRRDELQVSPMMARLADAVRTAGELTGGLVDATLGDQLQAAGYAGALGEQTPLRRALALAPARRPAAPRMSRDWRAIEVDLQRNIVRRPPGLRIDSGGLAKGLFADALAEMLASHSRFAIDCAGDLTVGGSEGAIRPIEVESPFDGRALHTFNARSTGVATSGIGRRSWLDAEGRPAHHLLDPANGRPAFTGVVQVSALAPSGLLAEIRAKAALLSGALAAPGWLPDGGLIVLDDGSHRVIEPRAAGIRGRIAGDRDPSAPRRADPREEQRAPAPAGHPAGAAA